MWRSTEPAPIPVPTGSFQTILAPSTGCSDPVKLANDKNLAAACSCQAATNSVVELVNTYVQAVEDYNSDLDIYKEYVSTLDDYEQCAKFGACTGDYAIYQAQFDALKNEKKRWNNCVLCFNLNNKGTSDQYCRDDFGVGYEYVDQAEGSCAAGSCLGNCRRTTSQAQKDWEPIFRAIPDIKPDTVVQPQVPEFDAQVAITCCSQNFNNIRGDTVKIYDITQECSAQVNKYITDVNNNTLPPGTLPPNPPGSFPVDGEEPAPAGLQTFAIVLIIVAVLVFIAMMIWVGVRLRKRRASSSASSEGTKASSASSEGTKASSASSEGTPPASEGRFRLFGKKKTTTAP